jgi:ribose 5-phosphate isomerase B
MKVGLASDHAGFSLKQFVKKILETTEIEIIDYGCFSDASCDYPDYAHALAKGIENGECRVGIGICGSGEGISMALNKHAGIRAALCWVPEIAELARKHNDANVLVMPGRFISEETAREIVDKFFNTEFEGGRHIRRVNKIPIQ